MNMELWKNCTREIWRLKKDIRTLSDPSETRSEVKNGKPFDVLYGNVTLSKARFSREAGNIAMDKTVFIVHIPTRDIYSLGREKNGRFLWS